MLLYEKEKGETELFMLLGTRHEYLFHKMFIAPNVQCKYQPWFPKVSIVQISPGSYFVAVRNCLYIVCSLSKDALVE